MNEKEVSIKFKNTVSGEAKVEKLAESLERINAYTNGIKEGTIKTIEVSSASINQNLAKIERNTRTSGLLQSGRALISTLKSASQKIGELTTKSMAYLETLNLYQVAFKEAGKSVEESTKETTKFINKMSEMYSLDESWLTETIARFKQLSNAMGLSGETGTKLSKILTQLSVDASSLYNVNPEQAVSKFTSALAGQTKPVRFFGADITEKTLGQTLQQLDISETVDQLSYTEKRLLIVISLVNQMKNAIGDWGKTLESPANQTRILSQQWERLQRSVGNVFLGTVAKILPYLNGIIMALVEIFNVIADIFGFDIGDYDYGVIEVADDFGTMSDNIGTAATNAKKLRQGLRGFDKLNVITTPSSGGAGGGASVGGGSGMNKKLLDALNSTYDEYINKLKNVESNATKIRDKILEWLGFTKHVDEETGKVYWKLDDTKNSIYEIAGRIKNIAKYLGQIAWGVIKTILNDLKSGGFGKVISGVLGGIENILKMASKNKTIINVLSKIIEFVLILKGIGAVSKVLGLSNSFSKLSDALKTNERELKDENKELSKFGKFVKNLPKTVDAVKTGVKGLVSLGGGLLIISDAFKNMAENGFNTANAMELVIGGMMTIKGVIDIATAAATLLGVGLTSALGVVGVVATALVGIVAVFSRGKSDLEKMADEMDELHQRAKDQADTNLVEISHIEELSNELDNLADANGRVKKSDEERVNYILGRLNEALGTEYKLVDGQITQNGKVVKSLKAVKDSIEEVIRKKKYEIIVDAYKDEYIQALKNEKKLNEELKKIEEGRADAAIYANGQAKIYMKMYKDALEENKKTIKDYDDLLAASYSENADDMDAQLYKYTQDTKYLTDGVKTMMGETKKQVDETGKSFKIFGKTYKTKIEVDADTSKAKSAFNKLFGENSGLKKFAASLGINLPKFASGGLPPVGQLFVANERGPELVGHIGGQSFVANQNQMMDLLDRKIDNSGTTNATIIVKVGDKEIAKQVINDLQDMAKTNGRPIEIG